MSETGLLLIIGVVATVMILAVWLERKYERERTRAIAAVARRLQWTFHGEDEDDDFPGRHEQFACFQRGHSRHAHNRMAGMLESLGGSLPVEAGDYHYKITRRSGKSSNTTTYRFSYLLVELPFGSRLPALVLRSEGIMDKLAGVIGFEDIDFESAEFSRRYHVSGTDRRFVYDLFHPRMIEWMLAEPPPQLEIASGVLLLVADGASDRWDPAEFKIAAHWTETFLSRWPDYLVRDLNSR